MKPALPLKGIRQYPIVAILCFLSIIVMGRSNGPVPTAYNSGHTISLHLTNTFNSAPIAADDYATSNGNASVDGNYINNDSDPDGDLLSMDGITIDPGGLHILIKTMLTVNGGRLKLYSDGLYTYLPPTNFTGSDQVMYSICDINQVPLCSSATIYFVVLPSNRLPLAVNFTSFTGKRSAKDNLLQWVTAQESNSHHFELENSTDNNNFVKIASIAAMGNSSSPRNYSFVHRDPAAVVNYYRLRQVDKDGRSTYSKVLVLRSDVTGMILNTVYPNPFVDKLDLTLTADRNETVGIQVYDSRGRLCLSQKAQTVKGLNVITLKGLEDLQGGVYFLEVNGTIDILQVKLLKR